MNPATTTTEAQSFRDWSKARPLTELLARAEAGVRTAPQNAGARWLLFELLCVLGQWDRALVQLRTWAGLDIKFDSTAHVLRGLIAAERKRAEVFAGRVPPAALAPDGAPAPAWIAGLGEALRIAATDAETLSPAARSIDSADQAREAAMAQASDTAAIGGSANLQPAFAWITDSDTRLGPVCELVVAGGYRWLAFADMASIAKSAPENLLDLVWSQAEITLRDGATFACHLPMRYPVQAGDRDALLLARETVWSDHGSTGVFARGQKMWTTDAGDMPLLDLRHCSFGIAGAAPTGGAHATE